MASLEVRNLDNGVDGIVNSINEGRWNSKWKSPINRGEVVLFSLIPIQEPESS